MEWITNSKLFKGSKYQDKILAAIADPINKPLVQQLTSYVDEKYEDAVLDVDDNSEPEAHSSSSKPKNSGPSGGRASHFSGSPGANGHFDMPEDVDLDDELDVDSPDDLPPETEVDEDESDVKETTKVPKSSIQAATYVTVETVSQAVTEIPGMLNLRDETAGVTYATLKGGTSNEIWIYYNSDVDINKVLDKVNTALINAEYYFLEFNRVSRDDNAIVFTINWISNYFKPITVEENSNE